MAWSEPLFICIVLLFLLLAELYLVRQNSSLLILLSIVTALACLTRYIGITLIVSGWLIISLTEKISPKTKIWHSFLFILTVTGLFGLWIGRNYAVSSTFFGSSMLSDYTLADNVALTIQGVYFWWIPVAVIDRLGLTGLNIITVVALAIAITCFLRVVPKENRTALKVVLSQTRPIVTFVVIYTAFLVISCTVRRYDPIGIRFLSPIYAPVVILTLSGAQAVIQMMEKQYSKRKINSIVVAISLIFLLPSMRTVGLNTTTRIMQGAGGYSTDLWQQSETIQYLQSHTLENNYPIYSNAADSMYILTGINGQLIPWKTASNSTPNNPDSIHPWPASPQAYLVWFDNAHNTVVTMDELKMKADFSERQRFSDGIIYIVSRKD
jgi:hypothetical protein